MIFGILGGIGPDMQNLMFMNQTADRLFGSDYRWSVLAAGRFRMPFATQSAMLGGSVRVGLEDPLNIGKGKLASSNAEQVAEIRTILAELGHEIASPAEARMILGLKGGDNVGFWGSPLAGDRRAGEQPAECWPATRCDLWSRRRPTPGWEHAEAGRPRDGPDVLVAQ